MPASVNYQTGHIKRNPDNGAVAVRTMFPEDEFPEMAWLIATVNTGAINRTSSYVASWEDVYTPQVESGTGS